MSSSKRRRTTIGRTGKAGTLSRSAPPKEAAERRRAGDKARMDEKLDEALAETFPASDPVALSPARE